MDDKDFPKLSIKPTTEATVKIASMCGMLGAAVSTASYLLIKGVTARTIESANVLFKEQFDFQQKTNK
jgi:hypothetical protein